MINWQWFTLTLIVNAEFGILVWLMIHLFTQLRIRLRTIRVTVDKIADRLEEIDSQIKENPPTVIDAPTINSR